MIDKDPHITNLIDLSSISLNTIHRNGDTIRIGACATFKTIEDCDLLRLPQYRALSEAAHSVGNIAIRNVGTVGGNICSAVPSADIPPPLIVLGAIAHIQGSLGTREISLEKFFVGSKRTILGRGDILTELEIPILPSRTASAFAKVGRVAGDIALVNVATRLTVDEGDTCRNVRIALGAVAPIPVRAFQAEQQLEGRAYDAGVLQKTAEVASNDAEPISDIRASAEYRLELVKTLVRRALENAHALAVSS